MSTETITIDSETLDAVADALRVIKAELNGMTADLDRIDARLGCPRGGVSMTADTRIDQLGRIEVLLAEVEANNDQIAANTVRRLAENERRLAAIESAVARLVAAREAATA